MTVSTYFNWNDTLYDKFYILWSYYQKGIIWIPNRLMNVYTIRGHIAACKWKSNAYIAGPIFCNRLNSSKCRLLVNKAKLGAQFILSTWQTRQSSTQNNKYQVSHKHGCFSWWAHSHVKHVKIDKYTKNKLCTKLALFTTLYRDARPTKYKKKKCHLIINKWTCPVATPFKICLEDKLLIS